MNTAIDIFIAVNDLIPKVVNRTLGQDIQANGKAVNISFVLKMLGISSVATGFSAGFTGRFIEEELAKKGIKPDFVHTEGITRLNVFTNVISQNTEYKLVNPGPFVSEENMKELLAKISAICSDDILCVSGSNPKGVPEDINVQIAQIAQKNGFKFVLDSSSSDVLDSLFCKPYILKPNIDELADWFGKKSLTDEEVVEYAKKLIEKGAQNVIVSLGSQGAIFVNKETAIYANAPKGKVVNTACAGDTMLATFLAGLVENKPIKDILRKAVAAGSSTAFKPGLTDFSDIDALTEQVKVVDIK
jgi:1-phosphofructokinase